MRINDVNLALIWEKSIGGHAILDVRKVALGRPVSWFGKSVDGVCYVPQMGKRKIKDVDGRWREMTYEEAKSADVAIIKIMDYY